ncbi:MAG TPA: YgiT-type zinc finger protein [Pyrinomonadaceae bacterium]|nr:YgiT-type zinc finger protein [Pyrinomonadaceae bacterium]
MKETMKETKVTYTLERDGKFYIIENVPARVSSITGEEFFAPEIVDRIQQIILTGKTPKKTIETPIFEFAA